MSNIISVTFKGLTCDNLINILKERERREWVIEEKNLDTLEYTYTNIGEILNKPFIYHINLILEVLDLEIFTYLFSEFKAGASTSL